MADLQDGLVPIHGRLFAQWLHYVFPRECPFPHKTGSVLQVKPADFGADFVATKTSALSILSLTIKLIGPVPQQKEAVA